jgi:hypothetical protein
MPYLAKRTISNFLRSECLRRLRLDLSPDNAAYQAERQGMPPKQSGRPGIATLTAAGTEWEEAKIADLRAAFGAASIIAPPSGSQEIDLATALAHRIPATLFITQGQYAVGNTFQTALAIQNYAKSLNLTYGRLRPDIIRIWPDHTGMQEVHPDGSVTAVDSSADNRIPLSIVDIKLTAEASACYQAEVTYYSMALAAWLIDNNLQTHYFVVPMAAVWPGSHDASHVARLNARVRATGAIPTTQELLNAWENDLEFVPFGVFASRIRRFFQSDLATVLTTPWQNLPWHVDNRCIGCDYLGYPWGQTVTDPLHCYPTAQATDNLSRVAFVTRGARSALEDHHVHSVANLAVLQPTADAYDTHQVLRATRTVVSGRAQSLASGAATVADQEGTSALMPRWADLRIFITADFDIGSGVTIAFGVSGRYAASTNRTNPGQQNSHIFPAEVYPVDQRDLQTERRELFRLLDRIRLMMQQTEQAIQNPTVQVYIWDSVIFEHLVRVIGRNLAHIINNQNYRDLAWLFPPENIVANPATSDRLSPITIVRDIVRALVALPVTHYYSLLNTARSYYPATINDPGGAFNVNPFFEDPFSDQIPSERAHEIWSRATGAFPWNQQLQTLQTTVARKLFALSAVVERLQDDLQGRLGQTAPRVAEIGPPRLPNQMSDDARLWFTFASLNVALSRLEVQLIRAMPPHEREARFNSAHLLTRLDPAAAAPILAALGLNPSPGLYIYQLAPNSREVRAREGDFNFALSPHNDGHFLDQRLGSVLAGNNVPLPPWATHQNYRMERVTGVTIRGIDRENRWIVLQFNSAWAPTIAAMEQAGLIDLSTDLMLDPVHNDFLLKRLEATLKDIGNPVLAVNNSAVAQALGIQRRASRRATTPPAQFLWDAQSLYALPVARALPPVRAALTSAGFNLNPSQWSAWERALAYRLRLIWGPPGTGKSRTLHAIILGALLEAIAAGRPLRVLITGPTYEAIDNVLLPLYTHLLGPGPFASSHVHTYRLRSETRPVGDNIPAAIDLPKTGYQILLTSLLNNNDLTVVGATPHQVYNLATADDQSPVRSLFDLILIDEASQLDVATSALALAPTTPNAALVVAGDPKQLPPIHQAEAPLDLETLVGPIFTYFTERHHIAAEVLEENYRSNSTIVDLAHLAEYPPTLHAFSPNLEINLLQPPPTAQSPVGWPAGLHWSPDWSAFLDPARRALAFVYSEGRSSQWNQFEADATAAIAVALFGKLANQLANENDPVTGNPIPITNTPYNDQQFWSTGIGIVTPHRAQQALVTTRLQQVFPGHDPALIRRAVDTVERFQGQQRDIMIATFALGDPDAIGSEEEFLLSLNRFNVMASRTRAKLIVLISRQVVDHLASDMDVLRESALLKSFVETFCNHHQPTTLAYLRGPTTVNVPGELRWH